MTIAPTTEKQTLMGLAYDVRQKLKDCEYKELCELIQEKEQRKKKYVKVQYRGIYVMNDEDGEVAPTLGRSPRLITAIFEIVEKYREGEDWDATILTQNMYDEWSATRLMHPPVCKHYGQEDAFWVMISSKVV